MKADGELIELEEMEIMAVLLDRLDGFIIFTPAEVANLHSHVEGATLSANPDGSYTFELKYKEKM